MRHDDIAYLAKILAKLCDDETLANLINCTLSADADPNLDDDEAEDASVFFEQLCNAAGPKVIELDQRQ